MMTFCKQPSLQIPPCGLKLDAFNPRRQKDKIVIVMGATGTGKSRLSIDLATCFPHHLLGILNPNADLTVTNFCYMASLAIERVLGHDRLPIIVGGSNSFIEHLVDDYKYNLRSKYDCCFLWVDVSMPILHSYVSKRVDEMIKNGMVNEVRRIFDPEANYAKGIRKAIGVPEFDKYFRFESDWDEKTRNRILQEAINEIKDNTCKLACRQLGKINRLRSKGWNLHRFDATEVYRKRGKKEAEEEWDRVVAGPSSMIVDQFLYDYVELHDFAGIRVPAIGTAMAAASH